MSWPSSSVSLVEMGTLLLRRSSQWHSSQKGADIPARSPRKAVASIPSDPLHGLWGVNTSVSFGAWLMATKHVHDHHHLIPGGLVVRIWHSHCHGLGSIPSQGKGFYSHCRSQSFTGWLHCPQAACGIQGPPYPVHGAGAGLYEFCCEVLASCPFTAIRLHLQAEKYPRWRATRSLW